MRIIIAGAGIAGLSAALSLHAVGITDVVIHERVNSIQPLGVGINILPHATRELIELGLGDRLAAIGVETADLTFVNRHGQHIWSEPRGLAAGYRWPQYSVHRGQLQMMLLQAVQERLGPDCVITGSPITGIDHDADLLIGADGIRSSVRHALFPREGDPVATGRALWRGTTVRPSFMTGRSMIMVGDDTVKIVIYPITKPDTNGEQVINWVIQHETKEVIPWDDWNRPVETARILQHIGQWNVDELDIDDLVRNARQAFEFPLVDRDPLPYWSADRVTLMGDAAHPMHPTGSNGGTQSIIDARVLAYALAQRRGLDFYEDERRPITTAVVRANRMEGPEVVLTLAAQRAPRGFDDIESVMPLSERARIAQHYKEIAGFDPATLNQRPSWSTQLVR